MGGEGRGGDGRGMGRDGRGGDGKGWEGRGWGGDGKLVEIVLYEVVSVIHTFEYLHHQPAVALHSGGDLYL